MQYRVIMPDGSAYGPADVPTLASWAAEGRLAPSTWVEDVATGQRMPASAIHGVFGASNPFPAANPTAEYYRANPYVGGYGYSGGGASGIAIAALVCSVAAFPLVCLWPLSIASAIAAIVLGAIGMKGNAQSRGMSIAGLVIGIIVFVGWIALLSVGFYYRSKLWF